MFQKELYNRIPTAAVWRELRKSLHFKERKLSIVQGVATSACNYLPALSVLFISHNTITVLLYRKEERKKEK
jgi:hypothetical protein